MYLEYVLTLVLLHECTKANGDSILSVGLTICYDVSHSRNNESDDSSNWN